MISASTNKEHYPLPCRLKAVFRYRVFFHIYTAIHITVRCFRHIHGFLLSPVYKKLKYPYSPTVPRPIRPAIPIDTKDKINTYNLWDD